MKDKKRLFTIFLSLALVIVLLFTVTNERKEVKLVYFIAKSSNSNFWETSFEGAKTAAREYNVELVIRAPFSEDNYSMQNVFIDDALASNADAIVFSACDYDMSVEYAAKAVSAGLNFVVIDSDINSKKKTAFIGTDNLEAGMKAGQTIIDLRGENAKIGIISCEEGGGVSIQRTKGFSDYIKTIPDAEIVELLYAESNIESPLSITKQMLERNPDINAIFTVNEWTTLGVGRAIDELGLSDSVSVVAFDNNIESIQMLEKGVIDTLVVQNPFAMGYLGVQKAIESPKNTYLEPEYINTGTALINRNNMYDIDNQKLLFPFSYQN